MAIKSVMPTSEPPSAAVPAKPPVRSPSIRGLPLIVPREGEKRGRLVMRILAGLMASFGVHVTVLAALMMTTLAIRLPVHLEGSRSVVSVESQFADFAVPEETLLEEIEVEVEPIVQPVPEPPPQVELYDPSDIPTEAVFAEPVRRELQPHTVRPVRVAEAIEVRPLHPTRPMSRPSHETTADPERLLTKRRQYDPDEPTPPQPQEEQPLRRRRIVRFVQVPSLPAAQLPQVVGTDDDRPARLISNPPPVYPREALARRQSGRVLLRLVIADTGDVTRAEVVETSGHTLLDNAAIVAVEKWQFEPARDNGLPVRATVLLPVRFRL